MWGNIYKLHRQTNQASHCFNNSLRAARKIKNYSLETQALLALVDIFNDAEYSKQVFEYFKRILETANKEEKQKEVAVILDNLARLCIKNNNTQLAIKYYQQGLEIVRVHGNRLEYFNQLSDNLQIQFGQFTRSTSPISIFNLDSTVFNKSIKSLIISNVVGAVVFAIFTPKTVKYYWCPFNFII